ncbi:hypothetical protein PAMC26577_09945 [Caballeronia sordidicola]|uniref:Uncharacterized protein n=1 Tax=Caballeronia sordidicola TaxID=196367 RepID=A0A242N0A3_CABSO|nr:hypothetical protein PAMC26577_09945 [Caballeronia sordidicola]
MNPVLPMRGKNAILMRLRVSAMALRGPRQKRRQKKARA